MANPYHHALSSVQKWGGTVEDYTPIHHWFDETKSWHGDWRHRAMRHHSQGIFECEKIFGNTITLSTGRIIPVRWIGEQHVTEDCGHVPTASDWLKAIATAEQWMVRSRKLSRELNTDEKEKQCTSHSSQTIPSTDTPTGNSICRTTMESVVTALRAVVQSNVRVCDAILAGLDLAMGGMTPRLSE